MANLQGDRATNTQRLLPLVLLASLLAACARSAATPTPTPAPAKVPVPTPTPAPLLLGDPVDVFVDSNERIYITDWNERRIVRLDAATGKWTSYGWLGEVRPFGIFVDPAGKIYLTETGPGHGRIWCRDDEAGTNMTQFGSFGSGEGHFDQPTGIWVDSSGRILVADWGNSRIVRMDDMLGTNWMTFP